MSSRGANPKLSNEALSELLMDLYGISGPLKPLVSYDDQNARVTTEEGRYVLKISNTAEDRNFLAFQNAMLAHLAMMAPNLTMPRLIKTLDGDDIGTLTHEGESHAVRLLTYLEGDIFEGVAKSEALYFNLGVFMGEFSAAMASFTSDIEYTPNVEWNLDNALKARAKTSAIVDADNHALIEGLFDHYERAVLPKLEGLRTGVLHQDANEFNLLVDPDDTTRITGLIDFGDVLEGRQINELAITCGYAMITSEDPIATAVALTKGYVSKFPITEQEAAVMLDLAVMRLCVSITLGSYRAAAFPENAAYITASQEPAYRTLRRLNALDEGDLTAAIVAAAGY